MTFAHSTQSTSDLQWASIEIIKLSDFDSPHDAIRDALQEKFKAAVMKDGFVMITDHGLTQTQVRYTALRFPLDTATIEFRADPFPKLDRQFEMVHKVLVEGAITPTEKQSLLTRYESVGFLV